MYTNLCIHGFGQHDTTVKTDTQFLTAEFHGSKCLIAPHNAGSRKAIADGKMRNKGC